MGRGRVVEATAIGLAMLALLWVGHSGCKKTDSPFGVYAPNGLDVPSPTPTPVSGDVEVFVKDGAFYVQGVTVVLVDANGVTSSPVVTQPSFGYAPFNPSNLMNGIWKAVIPTQGVSYVSGTNTINHYYYQSAQPFTVTGPGSYSVYFNSQPGSIGVSPVSVSYGFAYPLDIPLTVTYNQNGNINVPVSVSCPALPASNMNTMPSSFILGEGVTVQPVTIVKNTCFSFNFPFSASAVDFKNAPVKSYPTTIYHGYPVSITIYYYVNDGGPCSGYINCVSERPGHCYNFGINTTNDCGVTWDYAMYTGCGNGIDGTGTIFSGTTGEASYSFNKGDFVAFGIWNPTLPVTFVGYATLGNSTSPVAMSVTVY